MTRGLVSHTGRGRLDSGTFDFCCQTQFALDSSPRINQKLEITAIFVSIGFNDYDAQGMKLNDNSS